MSPLQKSLGIEGGPIPPTKENFTAASSLNKEMVDNKEKRDAAIKGAKEKNDLKRTTAFGDALTNISKTRSGNAAAAQGVVLRAERLETLANAYKSGNLDKRQIEELAIGLNAMLSGSNTGSSEQVKNLVPKTMMGNMMGIGEFLSNDPKGTNQQAFVDRMMGTVQREKATASQQVKRVVMQRAVPYQDLEKTNPDQFYNTLESNGVSREEWKAWRSGGYKQMSAVQSPDNPGGNGGGTNGGNDPLGIR
jgi:hypothetical protein